MRSLPLFLPATLLRLALLIYAAYHDAHSALKYTDIDYRVFTDAARLPTPYARATYRYTPLLAWLLRPGCGKLLFVAADLLAGVFLVLCLRRRGVSEGFAAVWLWNPFVAVISTRGNAEGLVALMAVALLWAVEARRVGLAAGVLGLAVHFKIYPFIYAPAVVWALDDGRPASGRRSVADRLVRFVSPERVELVCLSLSTFIVLNSIMYSIYGPPFFEHTFLHHLVRLDHRHNFSPYNILLYLSSATPHNPSSAALRVESLAFIPQLLLSCVLIPLVLAKRDLATCMLAQTLAFVTFNKVCTSQYFIWYLIFLPLHLPTSALLRRPVLGCLALLLWILAQAVWLDQAYRLEFLGISSFFPGLWLATLAFFLVNCWILGIIVCSPRVPRQGPRRVGLIEAHAFDGMMKTDLSKP